MSRSLFTIAGFLVLLGMSTPVEAQAGRDAGVGTELGVVYLKWRDAMIRKDLRAWQAVTASHRQIAIKNRIHSERRGLAQTLFSLPASPPDIRNLKGLGMRMKGQTANAFYFGKVDFAVGGTPTENLLVLSFVKEGGQWKYDTADYVNLSALPDVRKEFAAGKVGHLSKPEFEPKGVVQRPMVQLRGPVKYIAKTYVFCPGREVQVHVNKLSQHLFQNTKAAETIIGGARDGRNEVQYTIKALPGSQGTEPLTVRVYLLSEVNGVKPIKIYEYLVPEKGKPEALGSGTFNVTPEVVNRLNGK